MGNSSAHDKHVITGHEAYRTSDVDVDKEILKYKQLLDKNPGNGHYHENIAHLYMQKDLPEMAEQHFVKAHQLNQISSFSLFMLGSIKEEKREYIAALELLKEAVEKDHTNPEPYHKLAEIFLILKEIDKAIHYALECTKYKQNDPDLSNLIGLCYLLKNNLDKAQEYLMTANLLDSNNFRALNNLGNLNRKLNKLDRAIEYYKLAIRHNPTFFPASLNLGLAYFEKGDIWNGLVHIKESLKGGEEMESFVDRSGFEFFIREDILYNGIKFYHEGQLEIAAVFLEKAYQNNQDNIVTLYYIALLKFDTKEYQAASNLFHEVIRSLNNHYSARYKNTVWFRVLMDNCKDSCQKIMEKLDDTINLSELERLPPEHKMRVGQTEEGPYSPNSEIQKNLSQLSISQIVVEQDYARNHGI